MTRWRRNRAMALGGVSLPAIIVAQATWSDRLVPSLIDADEFNRIMFAVARAFGLLTHSGRKA